MQPIKKSISQKMNFKFLIIYIEKVSDYFVKYENYANSNVIQM